MSIRIGIAGIAGRMGRLLAEEVEAARGVTAEVESFAGGISGVRPAGRPAQAMAKSAVTAVEADRARKRVVYVRRTRG